MENSPQPEDFQQQALTPPPVTEIPVTPKRRWKAPLLIGGIAIMAVCVCVGMGVVLFGAGILGVASQKGDIQRVLDLSMQALSQKDENAAYIFFSKRAQRQVPLSQVREMISGANYVLWEGYTGLDVNYINIGPAVNTNPDVPQGIVARVSGTVRYNNGYTGSFQAVLEQEGKEWKLDAINVTVPPQKFQDSIQRQ